jgi:hypothetical protein
MFKITQNSLRYFTLTEVLLMVAINQAEAKGKVIRPPQSRCERIY